jgi:plastocyanin
VFSYATKVLMALTGAAMVGAGVYYAVEGGRAGAVLMLMLSLAAFFGLLVVIGAKVLDIAPDVPADAGPPEANAHTPGPAATGSLWPLLAAAALGLLAVGAATNAVVVYAGVIAVVLASIGWFSKAWADHPTWTPRVSGRVTERFVSPLTLPVGGTVLAALIAISISRILLATDVEIAPWISLVVAIAILGACAWVASKPRMASTILTAMAVVAGVAMVGAGAVGAAQGEREFHKEHEEEAVEIHAKDNNFAEKRVTAKITHDHEILIDFENDDEDVFHNVALYETEAPNAAPIWNGEGFPGPNTKHYAFEAPTPGSYAFRCDFHSNMVGTFEVVGG